MHPLGLSIRQCIIANRMTLGQIVEIGRQIRRLELAQHAVLMGDARSQLESDVRRCYGGMVELMESVLIAECRHAGQPWDGIEDSVAFQAVVL